MRLVIEGERTNQVSDGFGERADVTGTGTRDELDEIEAVGAMVATHCRYDRLHAFHSFAFLAH